MAEQKTRETLEAEWWEAWWTRGYSWPALANHSLGDELLENNKKGLWGESSLQDYWRRDPDTGKERTNEEMYRLGELIKTPDGMLWHRAHVPLRWQDGRDAKQAWDGANKQKLASILSPRLTKAGQNALEKNRSEPNLDHRAQFSGVVLPDLFGLPGIGLPADDMLPVSLVITHAWIGSFFASEVIFENDADFSYSFISGLAGFSGAEFKGKANFREVIFGNFVSFADVHFRDEVWLNQAILLGPANFEKTQFFGAAYFTSSSLRGTASFRQTVFHNSGNFNSANFEEFVDFSNSHYKKIVSFSDSNFASQVFFHEAIFDGLVFFNHTSFEDKVRFSATKFCQEGYFRGVKFKDSVSFSDIQAWGNGSYAWSGAFYGASASAGILSFEDSVPPPFAAFDGLNLAGDALLSFDDDGVKSLDAAFDHQTSLLTAPLKKDRDVDKGAAALDYQRFLGKLAGGCRVFKNYFDSRGDRERAQRFFRLELQARMKSGAVGRLERSVFWGYRIFSNYGASIGRPLKWLAGSVVFFWLSYWCIAATYLNPSLSHIKPTQESYSIQNVSEVMNNVLTLNFSAIDTRPMLGALSFSAHRSFPFGAWDVKAEDKYNNVRKILLGDGEGGANFTVRVLATIQSIFSLAMIFLSGLAIRRRFKMD